MSRSSLAAALLALALAAPSLLHAAPGDPDPTFDGDGHVLTPFPVPDAYDYDFTLLADRRIVVTGRAGDILNQQLSAALARYGSDGSLDPTFGTGGQLTDGGTFGFPLARPDGTLLTAESLSAFVSITRRLEDGAIDTTFGSGGHVTDDCGGLEYTFGLVGSTDGTFVVAATLDPTGTTADVCVMRYLADGARDTSFGSGGLVVVPGIYGRDLLAQPDGKLLIAALPAPDDTAVVRLTADGTLDPRFGDGGVARIPGLLALSALALQPNGKILAAGTAAENLVGDFGVARLLPNGSLDPHFGTDGIARVDVGSDNDIATTIALQADGKTIVGGVRSSGGLGTTERVTRLHPDGALDTTFGSAGVTYVTGGEHSTGIIVQPDGKALVNGFTTPFFPGWQNFAVSRIEALTIACAPTPLVGCHTPVAARKGQLSIKDAEVDAKDQLLWKWQKGDATTLADFGDPVAADDLTLCLYDESGGTPALLLGATVEAGGTCKGRPCWRPKGSSGYGFADRDRERFGVDTVKLKAGAAGKARIVVKGKGAALPTPSLPLPLPLRLQAVSTTGVCWETVFSEAGVTRNDAERFRAKSD